MERLRAIWAFTRLSLHSMSVIFALQPTKAGAENCAKRDFWNPDFALVQLAALIVACSFLPRSWTFSAPGFPGRHPRRPVEGGRPSVQDGMSDRFERVSRRAGWLPFVMGTSYVGAWT